MDPLTLFLEPTPTPSLATSTPSTTVNVGIGNLRVISAGFGTPTAEAETLPPGSEATATVTVDGTGTDLYAPSGGGGSQYDIEVNATLNGLTVASHDLSAADAIAVVTKAANGETVMGIAHCTANTYDDEDNIWGYNQYAMQLVDVSSTSYGGSACDGGWSLYFSRTTTNGTSITAETLTFSSPTDDPDMSPSASMKRKTVNS